MRHCHDSSSLAALPQKDIHVAHVYTFTHRRLTGISWLHEKLFSIMLNIQAFTHSFIHTH